MDGLVDNGRYIAYATNIDTICIIICSASSVSEESSEVLRLCVSNQTKFQCFDIAVQTRHIHQNIQITR